VSVTAKTNIASYDELLKLPESDWKKYEVGEWDTGKIDELFTPKDINIIKAAFNDWYDTDPDEMDAILKGSQTVSAG
jgi:hypothetical protein